jgi:hypothetical protein
MVVISTGELMYVNRDSGVVCEASEKLFDTLGTHGSNALDTEFNSELHVGFIRDVNDDSRESFVIDRVCGSVAVDSFAVANRLPDRLPDTHPYFFDCVMVVHVQIPIRRNT